EDILSDVLNNTDKLASLKSTKGG
ncbi:MAG: type VI secretion system contractile sheath small subunit, partial [Pseudomonadota bacterium]